MFSIPLHMKPYLLHMKIVCIILCFPYLVRILKGGAHGYTSHITKLVLAPLEVLTPICPQFGLNFLLWTEFSDNSNVYEHTAVDCTTALIGIEVPLLMK